MRTGPRPSSMTAGPQLPRLDRQVVVEAPVVAAVVGGAVVGAAVVAARSWAGPWSAARSWRGGRGGAVVGDPSWRRGRGRAGGRRRGRWAGSVVGGAVVGGSVVGGAVVGRGRRGRGRGSCPEGRAPRGRPVGPSGRVVSEVEMGLMDWISPPTPVTTGKPAGRGRGLGGGGRRPGRWPPPLPPPANRGGSGGTSLLGRPGDAPPKWCTRRGRAWSLRPKTAAGP
jgi:hypothetical protein